MAKRIQATGPTRSWNTGSSAEWIAHAERFERMADRLKDNPKLRQAFSQLAVDARHTAVRLAR